MTALTLSAALVVLLNVLAASRAEAQAVDPQELARLQGTWVMVAGTVDGKPLDAETIKKNRMTYVGNQVTLQSPQQSSEKIASTTTKLDPKQAPKTRPAPDARRASPVARAAAASCTSGRR
jgi:hypothetical protein